MFQNIAEEEKQENIIEDEIVQNKIDIKDILKKIFTKQNIIVYIISFMLSTVSTVNGMAPFGLAIFAATLSNGLPAGIVFIVSLIGTLVCIGGGEALTFILTALVLVMMVVGFKPWYEEEYKSERRKLGKYVIASVMIVQIIQILFRGFLLYDLFIGVTTAIATYIFYKIFSNSIVTISSFGQTKIYTVEEVIGASLMLAISLTALKGIQIFGLEIRSVLCILIVLILGWKKGILIRRDKRYYNRCSTWSNRRRISGFNCMLCNFWNDSRFLK